MLKIGRKRDRAVDVAVAAVQFWLSVPISFAFLRAENPVVWLELIRGVYEWVVWFLEIWVMFEREIGRTTCAGTIDKRADLKIPFIVYGVYPELNDMAKSVVQMYQKGWLNCKMLNCWVGMPDKIENNCFCCAFFWPGKSWVCVHEDAELWLILSKCYVWLKSASTGGVYIGKRNIATRKS